jgi:CHAT domain-containing protein
MTDDGVLTAKELANIDLRELELAVLSACQSGLGDVTGEGVFGMQRGFKKAGAKSILMSLWKVDDTATAMLMSEFYNNLTNGKSAYESLRTAQQYVRTYESEEEIKDESGETTKRRIRKFEDPFYWAAFVLLDAI